MGGTTEIQITPLDSNQALAQLSSNKTDL